MPPRSDEQRSQRAAQTRHRLRREITQKLRPHKGAKVIGAKVIGEKVIGEKVIGDKAFSEQLSGRLPDSGSCDCMRLDC